MIFGRLITAMVTPFTPSDTIDFDEAIRLATHLFDTGTEALVLCGTTGESPTLSHSEEFTLFKEMRRAFPKACLIAGSGSNCTKTAIESTREVEKMGLNGSMQVVPYYNRPSQEGLLAHFMSIADSTSLPIMLYNIPARTGRNMEADTIIQLAEHPQIVAIKEASGDINQARTIASKTPNSFCLYSGDDAWLLPIMGVGGVGVVSVAAHLVGADLAKAIHAVLSNEPDVATAIMDRIADLIEVLFVEPNPTPLKYALQRLGFNVGSPRLPLVPVLPSTQLKVDRCLTSLGMM